MSMVIEDSHLFVRHMLHYIFIMRMIIICTRSLNSVLRIRKKKSIFTFN